MSFRCQDFHFGVWFYSFQLDHYLYVSRSRDSLPERAPISSLIQNTEKKDEEVPHVENIQLTTEYNSGRFSDSGRQNMQVAKSYK